MAKVYTVVLTNKAKKNLEKIPVSLRKKINFIGYSLSVDPYLGKKLKGEYGEYRSIRVGTYRIIYRIDQEIVTIFIITIAHRQSVYKDL